MRREARPARLVTRRLPLVVPVKRVPFIDSKIVLCQIADAYTACACHNDVVEHLNTD